ncbi:MAG: hypothetical protein FWC99_06910 [Coriobacteriia bacterium]|nr:hypothetical protein [Coriobacteriia bacterium]
MNTLTSSGKTSAAEHALQSLQKNMNGASSLLGIKSSSDVNKKIMVSRDQEDNYGSPTRKRFTGCDGQEIIGILIDADVMLGAILFPNSDSSDSLLRVAPSPFYALSTMRIREELRSLFSQCAPKYLDALNDFFSKYLDCWNSGFAGAPVGYPGGILHGQELDEPVLASVYGVSNIDYIVTGDSRILQEETVDWPIAISASDFMGMTNEKLLSRAGQARFNSYQ